MAHNPTWYDGDLRARLIEATLEAVERQGVEYVSLRSVARSLGISHAAPRNHFSDKQELFAAIAIESFGRLDARLAPIAGAEDMTPVARLRAGALSYVRWVRANRARFQVMWRPALHGHAPDVARARVDAYDRWRELLREAHAHGLGRGLPRDTTVELAWTLLHGIASRAGSAPEPRQPSTSKLIDAAIDLLQRAP